MLLIVLLFHLVLDKIWALEGSSSCLKCWLPVCGGGGRCSQNTVILIRIGGCVCLNSFFMVQILLPYLVCKGEFSKRLFNNIFTSNFPFFKETKQSKTQFKNTWESVSWRPLVKSCDVAPITRICISTYLSIILYILISLPRLSRRVRSKGSRPDRSTAD